MRKTIKVLLTVLLVPVGVVGGFLAWWQFTYYDELHFVKGKMRTIPGVNILRAHGNEDITLEDIWAELEVRGKGQLNLFALTRASVTTGDNILVGRIRDLFPRYSAYGHFGVYETKTGKPLKSEAYGSSVQINNGGVLSSQFPEGIQTVQDVVSRFDEIYSVIQQWPTCPETKRISDAKGNKYCYCATNDNTNRQWPDKCSE